MDTLRLPELDLDLAAIQQRTRIRRVGWRSHVAWLREHFEAGQHVSIVVPTGGGKSYLTVEGILKLPVFRHVRVLFVDDKGDDETTMGFGAPILQYPLSLRDRLRMRQTRKGEEPPEHYRLIVPDWEWTPDGSHNRGVQHAREVVGRALNAWYKEARSDRPSAVVLDETAALTGTRPPSLNLSPLAKRNWRKIRYRRGSQIALTQAPLGVDSEFYHQPTHLYLGPILDQEQRRRLREIGGNSKVIEHVVEQLDDREFLFLGHKGRHMHVVMVGRG